MIQELRLCGKSKDMDNHAINIHAVTEVYKWQFENLIGIKIFPPRTTGFYF